MQCNAPDCGVELGLEGSDFLVTSCGHAFCSSCATNVCNSARCGHCDAVLTDDDVHICSPLSRQDSQVALCGHNPSQILAICGRALQFWDGQQILRLQLEQERIAALEKRNTKLKGVMTEMHAKQVSAVNIMQARIHALEKAKLQNEARQKRRLEEECTLLDQRRWLRNNFIATALKPQKTIQGATDQQSCTSMTSEQCVQPPQALHVQPRQRNSALLDASNRKYNPYELSEQAGTSASQEQE